jgi:hypothetical protein
MKNKVIILFALLMGLSLSVFAGSSMIPNVTDLPIVVQDVSNLTIVVNGKVSSNELASTTSNNEGVARVGALGGYNLKDYLEDTATRGLARDYPVFTYDKYPSTNLNISWTTGDVYDPENGYYHVNSGSATLLDNTVTYYYFATNGNPLTLKSTGSRPPASEAIYVATFVTAFGSIIHVGQGIGAGDELMYEDVAFANVMPSIITEGITVRPTGTNLTDILLTGGIEYHNLADRIVHDSFNFSTSNKLVMYYSTNGNNFTTTITNKFPIGLWNNTNGIAACDTSKWYRGIFMSVADSGQLNWILPTYEYTNETSAILGDDPDLPPSFTPYIPISTAYIFSGNDVNLRNDLTYWVDRRFMIRRGALTTSGGGGTTTTPTIQEVLLAGANTGGLVPKGMGNPVDAGDAANKSYVDSTINNINNQKAYVDSNGDDNEALIESSILPFKTIQAAINAAAINANSSNRFLICISPGTYTENITMSNYVSIRGDDIESTIILGNITFPPQYIDETGSEISLLTVRATNSDALMINAGSDSAYIGIRSCYLSSTYDNDDNYKSVIHMYRGLAEVYATTYLQLYDNANSAGSICNAQIFEHTTDTNNAGLSQFTSFGSSSEITCTDTNDIINMMLTHNNTDSACINTFIGGLFNIYLNDTNTIHENEIRIVAQKDAIGRTLSQGNVHRIYMAPTNSCNLFIAYSKDGTGDGVAISRNNHIRIVSGSSSNIWLGVASATNDKIRIYDTEIIQANAFDYHPRIYTNYGNSGKFYINTPHQNGDQIFGGAVDMSLINTVTPSTPQAGHVRLYPYTYAGLENPYFIDSSGNSARLARDNFYNGYNAETTKLNVGEAVYISSGLSPLNTPIVKRSNGSKPETMPSIGLVVQVGGIATGSIGRIMFFGRMEATMDTSAFASGDKLYVSATIDGGITNVAPTGTNIVQQIGTCHISSTNGYVSVRPWKPDTLGGLTPNKYTTYENPVFSSSAFMLTNSGAAKFSASDIPANTTNTYILPSQGGTLATYTDIQLVPISVIIGETNGIQKGRVVYQSGIYSNKPLIKYSSRNDSSTLPIIGVTLASGNYGDNIEVANFGPVRDIDTSVFSPNDMIYLGTNGLLSKASTILSDAIIMVGTCLSSNSTTGQILVNIRSYYMDGSFSGSMRYTVKNASTASNSTAAFFAINDIDESIRMVIRGSGNNRGKASIISSSANGTFYMSNNRRKPIIWDIDMTDTGDEFSHLVWPMMSLVPQTGTSNSFFGIGTTNPLMMLHVNGSGVISNMYRLSSNLYSNNEFIAYGDTTNLINIINTNLQAQINTETNRAYVAETNLQVRINNNSNRLNNIDINTQKWNNVATSTKFYANLGGGVQTFGNNTIDKVLYTNLVLNVNGIYSNSAARWTPNASNVMIKIDGNISVDMANNSTVYIYVYKNGASKCRVFSKRTTAAGEDLYASYSFVDITTNVMDYYEIFSQIQNGGTTLDTSNGNWWSGQILY